jgi:Schlafen, AlbA_2
MIQLSDEDILRRLTDTEDGTVERKTAGDYRDCLKTAVAFSNSLPVDDPGIIFVGVGDDGTVQDKLNLDSLQRDVARGLGKIYPRVYAQMKVLRDSTGKEFLAVIVRGSENRPHFAGPSYVRDGSRTIEASEGQFEGLIAERSSKAYKIREWLGREITFRIPEGRGVTVGYSFYRGPGPARVVDCSQFYVSIQFSSSQATVVKAYPLVFVEIGYDHEADRLELIGLPH